MAILLRLHLWSSIQLLVISISARSPFEVLWNVDSDRCKEEHVQIPLEQFGIVHNKGQKISGDKIVIFYEKRFGLYPYYDNYNSTQPINGGLPQNASLALHLLKVGKRILEQIRDPLFDGLAVIDFEHWRPLFEMNWDKKKVYQEQSVKLILEKNGDMPKTKAKDLARKEFEIAAKRFFEETLKLARRLRPRAHWGYYHYPFCDTRGNHSEYSCSKKARRYNDKLAFIYNGSDALFPSIYLNGEKSPEDAFRYVRAVLKETERIAQEQKPPLKYYMYSKFEYNPYESPKWFYNESDICNTVKQSADLGANGVVLWSTTNNFTERCDGVAHYMKTVLGPILQKIITDMKECRSTKCTAGEHCVLWQQAEKCSLQFNKEDYVCEPEKAGRRKPAWLTGCLTLERPFRIVDNFERDHAYGVTFRASVCDPIRYSMKVTQWPTTIWPSSKCCRSSSYC